MYIKLELYMKFKMTPEEVARKKPRIKNLDGSVSTELNTTFEFVDDKGKKFFINIPLIWNGKKLSRQSALAKARQAGLKNFSSFETKNAAVKATKKRSKAIEKAMNMKNKKFFILVILLIAVSFFFIWSSQAASLAEKVKGKILLQVEEHGEAWYVYPNSLQRYYLGRPADAFDIMRNLGLGISEKDFNNLNGYGRKSLSGKILLRVHAHGEAYYVYPNDLKMYYLGRPADAFDIMRNLGLGITNDNLAQIEVASDSNAVPSVASSAESQVNLYPKIYDYDFAIPKLLGRALDCGDGICRSDSEDGPPESYWCPIDCADPAQFSILNRGQFYAVVPKEYKDLGKKYVQDLIYCVSLLENFLGVDYPYDMLFASKYVSDDSTYGGYTGSTDTNGIFYKVGAWESMDMALADVVTNAKDGFLYKSSPTYCANTHELTHVFTGDYKFDSWVSEGVAEYSQKHNQAGSKESDKCEDYGWYGSAGWRGEEQEESRDYVNLKDYSDGEFDYEEYTGDMYVAARCFFEQIEKHYGADKFKLILAEYKKYIDDNEPDLYGAWYSGQVFVNHGVLPVLGEGARIQILEKFGY